MEDYYFSERKYTNKKDNLDYESYDSEQKNNSLGVGYINSNKYKMNNEEFEDSSTFDGNEIKAKNKRKLNLLIIIQIISCVLIIMTVLSMKYFMVGYYNMFHEWYSKEMDKSIIAGEGLEKYINVFNFSSNNTSENKINIVTNSINGENKKVNFKILNPVENGIITSKFGELREGSKPHKGIDIATDENSIIVSVSDGVVINVSEDSSYGKYIVVDHGDNIKTKYAHCNDILKFNGDSVSKGSDIALVGSTGDSTGNHIHLELIIDGEYYDPEPLFEKAYDI